MPGGYGYSGPWGSSGDSYTGGGSGSGSGPSKPDKNGGGGPTGPHVGEPVIPTVATYAPPISVGYGEGQVDPGLAAAAGIGPAAGGFPGTTVGQGEGITGIGADETIGTGLEVIPKKIKTKVTDWWSQLPSIQMLKGITSLLNKAPTLAQLRDPNFLAIMNEVFKNDPTRRDKYVEDYKDIMMESLGGEETFKNIYGDDVEGTFKEMLSTAEYEPGSEAERRIDPESYYDQPERDPEGKFFQPVSSRFANTIGNLEDIAGIAITDDMSGPFRQQIFDARAELDRQQGAGGGGGGGGIPSIPLPVPDPSDPTPDPDPIDLTPTPTIPPGTTLTPTPFDYSQWPQFTSAYPGYNQYSWPNYVNQGLGQWPQFDYWNQIANTFPGMN